MRLKNACDKSINPNNLSNCFDFLFVFVLISVRLDSLYLDRLFTVDFFAPCLLRVISMARKLRYQGKRTGP